MRIYQEGELMQNLVWLNWIIPMLITVLSGVCVFFFGEFIRTKWSEPNVQYAKLKSKISSALSYNANCYTIPVLLSNYNGVLPDVYLNVSDEFRQLACELRGFIEQRPTISLTIPTKEILYEASTYLIGISNGLSLSDASDTQTAQNNREHAINIRSLLGIYVGNVD